MKTTTTTEGRGLRRRTVRRGREWREKKSRWKNNDIYYSSQILISSI